MNLNLYLSFIAYACATTFLPGPNNVLMLSQAGRYGLRRCLPLLFGIWTGLLTVMLLAGGFCSALGAWIPSFARFFKYVGAAYILYLAWKTFRRGGMQRSGSGQGEGEDRPLGFPNGFLLQFLNVKVIMLGLAAYPGYFLPAGHNPLLVLLFAVSMTACCGTGNLIWALAGNFLSPVYDRFYKPVNALMALLLVWCACRVIS